MDVNTVVTALVAAAAGGLVTAVGGIARTRSTGRTAARLVYAELTRNCAAVAYYGATGRWPATEISHDAWDKQGEALARLRGADIFNCVYGGYAALEAVAYIAGDVTVGADERTELLNDNLARLCAALDAVADHAVIPPQQVSQEKARLTLPPVQVALSGAVSAPPSLLLQLADIQRAAGQQPPTALEAAAVPSPQRSAALSVTSIITRRVYDAKSTTETSPDLLTVARSEGQPPTGDLSVDDTYDAIGITQSFLTQVYEAPALRPEGIPFEAVVHYGVRYDNVFWDGQRIFVGDGDGDLFGRFSACLDVLAHEVCHILTGGLTFAGQSGAIMESVCDVLGILVKQWHLGTGVDAADWVVGKGLFVPSVNGVGLRSLKEPGTAYDDPRLGKDPQVSHMRQYVRTEADNGGVHINCGIPNRAFFRLATSLGGSAWERAGLIWYKTLTSGALTSSTTFVAFSGVTTGIAQSIFGAQSVELAATQEAWRTVGVTPRLSKRAAAVIQQLPASSAG
jgi:hypothetical protein